MLRVKVPAGQLAPSALRAIGEVSNRYGRGDGELSTRQNIQLHWLELSRLPDVLGDLERFGVTTAGGCGDTVRNITGCPLQGIAADELFDATPVVTAAADLFYGNPDWANLPRKHKYSISACPDRCNAPEINCISLIGGARGPARNGGLRRARRRAGSPRSRGSPASSASSFPGRRQTRSWARSRASWSEDARYRVSRVKARLQVHGRRHRPRGDPRAGRGAARTPAQQLRARAASRSSPLPPPRRPPPEAGGPLLHRRPGPPWGSSRAT